MYRYIKCPAALAPIDGSGRRGAMSEKLEAGIDGQMEHHASTGDSCLKHTHNSVQAQCPVS